MILFKIYFWSSYLQQSGANLCSIFLPQWILPNLTGNNACAPYAGRPFCGWEILGNRSSCSIFVSCHSFDYRWHSIGIVDDFFHEALIFAGYEIVVNL